MNVLVLSLVFPPDNVSTAQIVGALASQFAAAGHEVAVVTTVPHYHPEAAEGWSAGTTPLAGGLVRRVRDGAVTSYHVWMPRKGAVPVLRVLAWLWFHLASTVVGLSLRFRPDVVFAPSPPLTIAVSAWLLARRHGVRFIYNVQEIYPDVAIALGAVRNAPLVRVLRRLEAWVYRHAWRVTVIGTGMRANLLAKGVAPERVVVIPNFVDPAELPVRPRDNAFSREHGLAGKFVVSYAGNIGVPQGLDVLIDAARLLSHRPDILFLLVGEGAATASLRAQADAQGIGNVRFVPFQPFSAVPDIYGASDACVVPQAPGTGVHGLPSKIYRLMACGRPIIAVCDHDSDVAALVTEAGCGVVVPPGDGAAMARAVEVAAGQGSAWASRGQRARQWVAERYSAESVSRQYLDLFAAAARAHG